MKTTRRLFSLMLVMLLLICTLPVQARAEYLDSADISYDEAVEKLAAIDILTGFQENIDSPDGTITRAQAAKMIAYLQLGGQEPTSLAKAAPTFSDVPGDPKFSWAAPYIQYCVSKGIIAGEGTGLFNPGGTVASIEFAKMFLTALGYDSDIQRFTGNSWLIDTLRAPNAYLFDDVARASLLFGNLTVTNYTSGSELNQKVIITRTALDNALRYYDAADSNIRNLNLVGRDIVANSGKRTAAPVGADQDILKYCVDNGTSLTFITSGCSVTVPSEEVQKVHAAGVSTLLMATRQEQGQVHVTFTGDRDSFEGNLTVLTTLPADGSPSPSILIQQDGTVLPNTTINPAANGYTAEAKVAAGTASAFSLHHAQDPRSANTMDDYANLFFATREAAGSKALSETHDPNRIAMIDTYLDLIGRRNDSSGAGQNRYEDLFFFQGQYEILSPNLISNPIYAKTGGTMGLETRREIFVDDYIAGPGIAAVVEEEIYPEDQPDYPG